MYKGGRSTTLVLVVCEGIRIPLSACNTTFAFDNHVSLLCTELGTDGLRLGGVASASASLSTLLGRGSS